MQRITRNVATLFALITLSFVLASYSGIIPAKLTDAPRSNGCYLTIIQYCESTGNSVLDVGECVLAVADEVATPVIVCTRGNFICCYQLNNVQCADCLPNTGYQFSLIRFKQLPD